MIENSEEPSRVRLKSAVEHAGLFLHVLLEARREEIGVLVLFHLVGEYFLGSLIFLEGIGKVSLTERRQALLSLIGVKYCCLATKKDQEFDNLLNFGCLLDLLLVLLIVLFWSS